MARVKSTGRPAGIPRASASAVVTCGFVEVPEAQRDVAVAVMVVTQVVQRGTLGRRNVRDVGRRDRDDHDVLGNGVDAVHADAQRERVVCGIGFR